MDSGYIDVNRWFARYDLFFDCQIDAKEGGNTEAVYLNYLPLYLPGSALLCFKELSVIDRAGGPSVKEPLAAFHKLDRTAAYSNFISRLQKETLLKVFGLTPEKAFSKLVNKRFTIGEDD